jgi:ketosteroid isomerase-like protein
MINESLALAVDWLDAYRGKSLDIVDMYDDDATISCGCNGLSLAGYAAIEAYWIDRFRVHPALELVDIKPTDGSAVFVSYRTSIEIVKAVLVFGTASNKIARHRCGPDAVIRSLPAGVH